MYISDEYSVFDLIIALALETSLCCFLMVPTMLVFQTSVALPGANLQNSCMWLHYNLFSNMDSLATRTHPVEGHVQDCVQDLCPNMVTVA